MPSAVNNHTPIGSILSAQLTAAPSGYLLCDGSAVSRTIYASLFAAVGVAHGVGDGSTTFNLPDLRGRFLRGMAGASTRDPDKASRNPANGGNSGNNIGSVQDHAMQDHQHQSNHYHSPFGAAGTGHTLGNANGVTGGQSSLVGPSSGVPGNVTSSETRPSNLYTNFFIKY